jgi:hypothetical protein
MAPPAGPRTGLRPGRGQWTALWSAALGSGWTCAGLAGYPDGSVRSGHRLAGYPDGSARSGHRGAGSCRPAGDRRDHSRCSSTWPTRSLMVWPVEIPSAAIRRRSRIIFCGRFGAALTEDPLPSLVVVASEHSVQSSWVGDSRATQDRDMHSIGSLWVADCGMAATPAASCRQNYGQRPLRSPRDYQPPRYVT